MAIPKFGFRLQVQGTLKREMCVLASKVPNGQKEFGKQLPQPI